MPALLQGARLSGFPPMPLPSVTCVLPVSGHDVIGLSETGSGKTLAYLLPLVHKLLLSPRAASPAGAGVASPRACILAPTRELADQITAVLSEFMRNVRAMGWSTATLLPLCSVLALVGGSAVGDDIAALSAQAITVVVATPGRLIHLLETKALALQTCVPLVTRVCPWPGCQPCFRFLCRLEYLVLDEVDKMLEMSMEEQIRAVRGDACQLLGYKCHLWGALRPLFLADPVAVQYHWSSDLSACPGCLLVLQQPVGFFCTEVCVCVCVLCQLWSATLPASLDRLARSAVHEAVTVSVGMGESAEGSATASVRQDVLVLPPDKKMVRCALTASVASVFCGGW